MAAVSGRMSPRVPLALMRSPTTPTSYGPARRGAALLCWGLSRRGAMRLCGERLGSVGMGVEECGWAGTASCAPSPLTGPLTFVWRRVAHR